MVTNTFTKYAKYTVEELESYVADPNSCVQKLEWTNLVSVLPKYLGNICDGVRACLTQKIGKYDRSVDGIILAFKNTKILNHLSAIRPNSVRSHVKVSTDFYVFRPVSGATIEGTIKYVSKNYLSAVIYRVFNVTIRLQRQKLHEIKQGRVISFIVKSYDMKSDLPYIEGELITTPDEQLPEFEEHIVKKEKSSKRQTGIKAEPMDVQEEVTEVKTNAETISIPHRIRSKTEPATEESESDDGDDNEDADDVKESMKAILDNLQKEMSDAVDSASESIEKSEISSAKEQDANKKTKPKKIDEPSSAKKANKRKHAKMNGHSSGDAAGQHEDMEDSIQAILSGIEKEMSDATDSDRGTSRLNDTTEVPFAKPSPSKKKKKKSTIDSLEKELLLKLAAEYSEQDSHPAEPVETQKEPEKSSKKKKKKPKVSTEDDFEASIMSSILKCAALAEESEPKKNNPASSPAKRKTGKTTARKSVRFDSTITEASFNAFDSSELLEISQLQSPTLSSTLKGSS
nr:FK506-binding protein 5 isoform X2 [Aedes albopictus]